MSTLAPSLALGLFALPALAQQAPAEQAETVLPEVKVRGGRTYKPQESASSKQAAALMDTPQSITVVPQAVLQDQGVTTLRDALRNVAGISLAAGEGGAQGDSLTLRGFSARNDLFLDGMRDFGSYYRDSFNLETVEVTKGASSVLFGRGSTGGTVNQISKTARLRGASSLTLMGGTDHTHRLTGDLNTALGEHSAFRVNVLSHNSDVAGRDVAQNQRSGFAPTLSFGLRTPTVVTVSYLHQTENNVPDYGIPWFYDRPADVDRSNYYGFKDANYLITTVDVFTARIEHQVSESLSIRDQVRHGRYARDVQITEARMPATGLTPATPLGSISVTRGQITAESAETFLQNQLDLTLRGASGAFSHTLVAGVEATREGSSPVRPTITFAGANGTTSLVRPDPGSPYVPSGISSTSYTTAVARSLGVYALETVKWGEAWEFLAGFRWDRFAAEFDQKVVAAATTTSAFDHTDTMLSWRAGTVFKPLPNGSVYVSYGTSFNPSAEALALSASTADVDPEKNRNLEVGTKWDLAAGRLSLSGALYRLEKTNARVPDPAPGSISNILGGSQRVQGFELGLAGRIGERWQVFSGYAYADSEVVATTTAHTQGNPLANAPKHTFSLWTTYAPSAAVEVGAGLQGVSRRVANSTAIEYGAGSGTWKLKEADGYVKVDLMAKVRITAKVDLQVNLLNAANKAYWDLLHPSHVVPGATRTLLVGLNAKF